MNTLQATLKEFRTDFHNFYDFGSIIGRGKYAVVKKCYCKQTRKCYAAKVIRKHRAVDNRLRLNVVENEIRALRLVQSHPSIISLYDVFHIQDEIVLMLEYATQRDLHPYLGLFNEVKCAHIIYQVLKALEFLHSKNILHLDIKPENVLLMFPTKKQIGQNENGTETTNGSANDNDEHYVVDDDFNPDLYDINDIKVKLCDFSFSQIMTNGSKVLGMMGTVAYSAPETLEFDALTKATDMWSLGALTHVLLSSYTPFGNGDEDNLETQSNILDTRNEPFKCDDEYFENIPDISDEAKSFIEDLLKYRPKQRLTVEQAINHKWFKKINIYDNNNESVIITNNNADVVVQVDSTSTPTNNNNNNTNGVTAVIAPVQAQTTVTQHENEIDDNPIATTIIKSIHLHYESTNIQFDKQTTTTTTILNSKIRHNSVSDSS